MRSTMRLEALGLLVAVGTLLTVAVMSAKAAPGTGWSPLALLQWAMLGGAVLQFVAGGLWKPTVQWTGKILGFGVISGVLFAIPYATSALAVHQVGAGFVVMAFALPLMMTYAIALVIGLERFDPLRATGIMFGVVGAFFLASSKSGVGGESLFWVAVVLLGQVVIAIGNIYRTRYWPKGATPLQLSVVMMFFGSISLMVFNSGLGNEVTPVAWSAEATGLLLGQMLVFAVLFKLYFLLQHLAGPVYLSQIGMVSALVGVAAAFMLFGEIPALEFAFAAPFIVAGIWCVNRRSAQRVVAEQAS